ncbi:lasso peptide biosynthesis PqqD family chaperone [Streptomyces spectabilis]|uniref:Lasso peptide biosynthesis PqqD family chaperone n=1 Tax=Streptomyces spectabilis TaxID=68270 RepID=A0A516RIW4_STRST|nr:lasso peptide biosynthesis PqqD family chaperone [Streptomyces spectabilis]QDQ15589.1 lasso peptide biosynthesis PqqD family chaperone [Streptomyces spectabilis]
MALALRPTVLMTETEYGVALLDQRSGDYWTLNPTAACVLRCLIQGSGTDGAVLALTGEYDVTAEAAEEDVDRIVDELRSARLVRAEGEDA